MPSTLMSLYGQRKTCAVELCRTDLQEAVTTLITCLSNTILQYAPNKLELLLHRVRRRGAPPREATVFRRHGIRITMEEGTLMSKIWVLGLWLKEIGSNTELVTRFHKKVMAATSFTRSIRN